MRPAPRTPAGGSPATPASRATRASRFFFGAVVWTLVTSAAPPADAQPKSPATAAPATAAPTGASDSTPQNEPKTKEQLDAQLHFQRAKDLYQTGSYREAVAELQAAQVLDPKAKDLVFNLGIVHEKLDKFDEAIVFFRQYVEMEGVTQAERVKAETNIKRIEGAKREVPKKPVATSAPPPVPPPPTPEPRRGRIDAATVNAAVLAVVGLGVGTTFGILAVSNEPKNFVTGRDGTYEDLKAKQSDAHTQALVADIGFGVGIVAAALTAYLYFGRTKQTKTSAVAPSVVPVRSGGVLLLGGFFR